MTPRLNALLAGVVLAGGLAALAILAALVIPKPPGNYAVAQSGTISGPGTIAGYPRAVDGDTLEFAGDIRVRFAEIDAPEREQMCVEGAWRIWACGEAARSALGAILRRGPVSCTVRSQDIYGRSVATCDGNGGDIGGQLVALGWAVVWPRYSTGRYDDRQEAAKAERAGVWSGSFQEPWVWRQEHRNASNH